MTVAMRPLPVSAKGAIGRAMLVLQCLAGHDVPVRFIDIVRQTGLPRSTLHRLLTTLEEHQAIRRSGTGYVVGELINGLSGHDGWSEARRVLMPLLTELHEATRLCTTLAALRDLTAVSLVTLYPRSLAGQVLNSPERMPVHCTALGKLLVAYAGGDVRLPPGERWLVPFSPATITRRAQFDTELERIERDGIARSNGELTPNIEALAVPVVTSNGRVLAIGVAGPTIAPDVEARLRSTAHAASLALRRRPQPYDEEPSRLRA